MDLNFIELLFSWCGFYLCILEEKQVSTFSSIFESGRKLTTDRVFIIQYKLVTVTELDFLILYQNSLTLSSS